MAQPTIPVFPTLPGLAYPVTRTNDVSTSRMQAQTGRRFAQPYWPYPVYHYEINIAAIRNYVGYTEYQTLNGFWNQVMTTPGQLFIWTDPNDGTVTNQYFGTGDGSRTLFQAMRTMGGFIEPVTAVLQNPDVPTQIVDNGLVTSGVTSTVDNGTLPGAPSSTIDYGAVYLTHFYIDGVEANVTIFNGGVLQFDSPPANGSILTWTGIYGWLCQFDTDTIALANMASGFFNLDSLTFTTARPNV